MSCGYKIGKLKNFVYLVKGLEYKEIDYKVNIVKGDVYKLNATLVTLNELESFKGRFQFDTTVEVTLNRIIDDDLLKINQFKIVVEDLSGLQFLVNPEFYAEYTSDFVINSDEVTFKMSFKTLSNIPVKIVLTKITPTNTEVAKECRYDKVGIDKLFIKNALNDYLLVNFLKCSYQRQYNGRFTDINILFTIPVLDNNWHYDLIKFPNNLWDAKMLSNNTELKDYSLFPQYQRLTQSELGTADIFTINLRGVYGGTLLGNSSQQSLIRWVSTDLFICDKFDKYAKEIKLILINGIWKDTTEFRKGILIQRNSSDCGYIPGVIYKWVTLDPKQYYECVGTSKYYREAQYQSTDNGETWDRTDVTRAGALYQLNSEDCGYHKEEWIPVEGEYICEEYDPTVTWVLTDEYFCKAINI